MHVAQVPQHVHWGGATAFTSQRGHCIHVAEVHSCGGVTAFKSQRCIPVEVPLHSHRRGAFLWSCPCIHIVEVHCCGGVTAFMSQRCIAVEVLLHSCRTGAFLWRCHCIHVAQVSFASQSEIQVAFCVIHFAFCVYPRPVASLWVLNMRLAHAFIVVASLWVLNMRLAHAFIVAHMVLHRILLPPRVLGISLPSLHRQSLHRLLPMRASCFILHCSCHLLLPPVAPCCLPPAVAPCT